MASTPKSEGTPGVQGPVYYMTKLRVVNNYTNPLTVTPTITKLGPRPEELSIGGSVQYELYTYINPVLGTRWYAVRDPATGNDVSELHLGDASVGWDVICTPSYPTNALTYWPRQGAGEQVTLFDFEEGSDSMATARDSDGIAGGPPAKLVTTVTNNKDVLQVEIAQNGGTFDPTKLVNVGLYNTGYQDLHTVVRIENGDTYPQTLSVGDHMAFRVRHRDATHTQLLSTYGTWNNLVVSRVDLSEGYDYDDLEFPHSDHNGNDTLLYQSSKDHKGTLVNFSTGIFSDRYGDSAIADGPGAWIEPVIVSDDTIHINVYRQ